MMLPGGDWYCMGRARERDRNSYRPLGAICRASCRPLGAPSWTGRFAVMNKECNLPRPQRHNKHAAIPTYAATEWVASFQVPVSYRYRTRADPAMIQHILDGGMGHLLKQDPALETFGLPYDQRFVAAALACIKCPEAVREAHVRYIDARCTVITTNSFTATPYHFKRAGVTSDYLTVVKVCPAHTYFHSRLPSLCGLAFCMGSLDSITMPSYADRQLEDVPKKRRHLGRPAALSR